MPGHEWTVWTRGFRGNVSDFRSWGRSGMASGMKERLMELIVCPKTGERLHLAVDRRDGDEIVEGHLASPDGTIYPISGGIPRLLPDPAKVSRAQQDTVDRFGEQWNDFDFLDDHYEEQFLGWISPNTKATFEDQVVLEGGCGKGRHSTLCARWGAREVLAIDLGSAVEVAYRNCLHLPNVHIIQADLFHLPVCRRSVDVAFSVGVLHHTPNPGHCFEELVKTVRPGGRVIAWVYGRENNGWIIYGVNPLRMAITSKLPHRWVRELARVPAAMIMAVGRGLYQPLNRPPFASVGRNLFYAPYITHISKFPYDEIHSIVHDHLTPPIAHYIPREEFESWFEALRLEEVTIGWHNENSWRGTGIVPEPFRGTA